MILIDSSYCQYHSERHDPHRQLVNWDAVLSAGHHVVPGADSLLRRNPPGCLAGWPEAAALLRDSAGHLRSAYDDLADEVAHGRRSAALPVATDRAVELDRIRALLGGPTRRRCDIWSRSTGGSPVSPTASPAPGDAPARPPEFCGRCDRSGAPTSQHRWKSTEPRETRHGTEPAGALRPRHRRRARTALGRPGRRRDGGRHRPAPTPPTAGGGGCGQSAAIAAVGVINVATPPSAPPATTVPAAFGMLVNKACEFPARETATDASIFLTFEVTDEQRSAVNRALDADPAVRTLRYESREQAYATFKGMYEDAPELVAAVQVSQMPESFRVALTGRSEYPSLAARVQRLPGVDQVIGIDCPAGTSASAVD
ncbi:permease-like cell division protein FtsX [Micromonospora sp. M12]